MDKGIPPGRRGIQQGADHRDLSKSSGLPEKTGSFSTKDVVNYPGKSYIPGSDVSDPEGRPLTEWEIAIADTEKTYFNAVASVESSAGESGTDAKTALARQLSNLSSSASKIISDYNKRVVELGFSDELSATNVHKLQRQIATNLRGCVDQFNKLKSQASSTSKKASQQSAPKLAEETQAIIQRFNTHLASLKSALDTASTRLSPELAVAKLDSELRSLQKQLIKLPDGQLDPFSNQVRLHVGRAVDHVSKPEAIQKSWGPAKKAQANVQKEVLKKTYDDVLNLRKQKFNALDLSVKKKKVKPSSTEASTIKQILQAHLTNAIKALNDFTTWQPSPTPQPSSQAKRNVSGSNSSAIKSTAIKSTAIKSSSPQQPVDNQTKAGASLVPSESPVLPLPSHFEVTSQQLKTPALQVLLEDVEASISTVEQTDKMKTLQEFLAAKYEKYRQMEPMLAYAAQKSRLMRGAETELLATMQHSLKGLRDYQQAVASDPFDARTQDALKAADAGLAKLDAMKDQIPPSLKHLLTEALPLNPLPEDYLVNFLNRQLLQDNGRFLVAPRDPESYQVMTDYLERALRQGEKAAAPYLHQMLDKAFKSYESVAALAGKPQTLEEANALIPLYKKWSEKDATTLREVDQLIQQTAKDLEGSELSEGVKAYRDLTEGLQQRNMQEAAETASSQHQQLHQILQHSISEMIQQRLQSHGRFKKTFSHSKVSEQVAQEINTQLGGLAAVAINPGKKLSDAQSEVILNLSPSIDKTSVEFEQAINQNTPALQELREKLSAKEHKELFQFDGSHCRWIHHPPRMLSAFTARFNRSFHLSQQAIELAKNKKPELQRFADARAAVTAIAATVQWDIPPARGFSTLKPSTKKAIKHLRSLEAHMKNLGSLTLQDIQKTVGKEQQRVIEMLKVRQISIGQATAALKPLFALHQAAKSRNLNAEPEVTMAPPATYTTSLDKLHRTLSPRILHQMFRSKKWKALEHAKALVSISESCRNTPMQAVRMLTNYSSSLANTTDRYYLDLGKALDAYGDYLCQNTEHSTRQVEAN